VRYQAALRPDFEWSSLILNYFPRPRRGGRLLHLTRRSHAGPSRRSPSRERNKAATNPLQRGDRYNVTFMPGLVYAAVAYVRSPVGIFVEELRRELHPAHTHANAHLTVLPPRPLGGTEQQALGMLREVCQTVAAFEITMGEVESFVPITPTVFLRVARGAYRMRELHDRLNQGALAYEEPWPYMPHLTIVKTDTVEEARKVEAIARQRWEANGEVRTVRIGSVTFVKGIGERWLDLETVPLSGATAR
jgi:2'-5' RNA ligase